MRKKLLYRLICKLAAERCIKLAMGKKQIDVFNIEKKGRREDYGIYITTYITFKRNIKSVAVKALQKSLVISFPGNILEIRVETRKFAPKVI